MLFYERHTPGATPEGNVVTNAELCLVLFGETTSRRNWCLPRAWHPGLEWPRLALELVYTLAFCISRVSPVFSTPARTPSWPADPRDPRRAEKGVRERTTTGKWVGTGRNERASAGGSSHYSPPKPGRYQPPYPPSPPHIHAVDDVQSRIPYAQQLPPRFSNPPKFVSPHCTISHLFDLNCQTSIPPLQAAFVIPCFRCAPKSRFKHEFFFIFDWFSKFVKNKNRKTMNFKVFCIDRSIITIN